MVNQIVYVLKLQNKKWYVGETSNLSEVLKKIEKGICIPWITRNKPIKLEKLFEGGNLESITLEYMRKYGWQNVRGYMWEQWTLRKPPRQLTKILEKRKQDLKNKLKAAQNYKCYNCETKLYDLMEEIEIRKWFQPCWRCKNETEVVSYIEKANEYGSGIGSHQEIDEILMDLYPQVGWVYSNTQGKRLIANKCQHCGAYQGQYYLEHDLDWDAAIYYNDNSYEDNFPIDRILSPGHIVHLDRNKKNNDLSNLALLCSNCYKAYKKQNKKSNIKMK